MLKAICCAGALSLAALVTTPASAHDASDVGRQLRDRGYYNIEFLVTNPPHFQVNACQRGERFHMHVDSYGAVTERSTIGPCHRHWWRFRRDVRD